MKRSRYPETPMPLYQLPVCECLRCPVPYFWHPRSGSRPHVCPKCHSPYWDVPRKIKKDKI